MGAVCPKVPFKMGNDASSGIHRKEKPRHPKPWWNPREKKKERDPDAMDVDFTQMTPDKKEQLMRSGSCFRCEKQRHLSRNCPTRNKASTREADMGPRTENPKPTKGKSKKPPPYETLVKQINACSMEDRQKLLEVFSQDRDSGEEDFWKAQFTRSWCKPTM